MPKSITLQLPPKQSADAEIYTALAARQLGIRRSDVAMVRVVKRSIDARRSPIKVNLSLEVFVDNEPQPAPLHFDYPDVSKATEVVVVGSGPAGLFAALRLIELGFKPILLERGKHILPRKQDIALINRNLDIDPDSNYAFGAGGAGTFSDGKLFTRSKKRGDYNKALQTLVFHGATPEILYEAHPHIGTDKLPRIISNICNTITTAGGQIYFSSKVTGFKIEGDRLKGVWVGDHLVEGAAVVLATGHSAKDIYHTLHRDGVRLEAKAFAMGVRIEHLQQNIDKAQYGRHDPVLPPADYKLVKHLENETVYTFCMCPGGYVVAAASENGRCVTNGMSYADRDGVNANAALLVTLNPRDFPDEGALSGMEWQERIEEAAFQAGGSNYHAPAQLVGDFLKGVPSVGPGSVQPTYRPGVTWCDLHSVLPEKITCALAEALPQLDGNLSGFADADAVLTAPETRSSSPVRIIRDDTKQSIGLKGLYPAGEGAGYAGGIMSAAIDGIMCAEALLENL